MIKIYQYLKIAFLIFSFVFINSCKKETGIKLSFHGRLIDGQTMQPISNYPLRLNFIHSSAGMGLNLDSYSDIANCVTNGNGEYILTIRSTYALDSSDKYRIESSSYSDNYFGVAKEINAQKAEILKSNSVDSIKVYKKIIANFYIRHSGVANADDFILININGVFNFGNDLFYGTDSLKENSHEVVPNSPTIILWRGIKNNIHFGPITDTVFFRNANNFYVISY